MAARFQLNLRGLITPLALLKCKSRLETMEKGDVLEVIVGDADVAGDLTLIVGRSRDRIAYNRENPKGFFLGIEKG